MASLSIESPTITRIRWIHYEFTIGEDQKGETIFGCYEPPRDIISIHLSAHAALEKEREHHKRRLDDQSLRFSIFRTLEHEELHRSIEKCGTYSTEQSEFWVYRLTEHPDWW